MFPHAKLFHPALPHIHTHCLSGAYLSISGSALKSSNLWKISKTFRSFTESVGEVLVPNIPMEVSKSI